MPSKNLGTPDARVLLVTGAYYPEISAAGVQCRAVAASLGERARFSVLTTAVDRSLPPTEIVDDVTVHRLTINVRSRLSKATTSARLVAHVLRTNASFDLVHVHGFSQKNVLVAALTRLLRKPYVLSLHTAGQDEPEEVRRRGRLSYWAFMSPDLVLSVSPYLSARYQDANPSFKDRLRLIPNGVDITRFRPADRSERLALRRALGWPETQPTVLFVGFFSRDKRPDLLFRAWSRIVASVRPRLVYVGATGPGYYEIDEALVRRMRAEAGALGRADDVVFTGPTNEIERYFRAADLFVLPSARESQSVALLEAMACGLPSIATRLPGATDVFIDDGVNGRLVPPDDEPALAEALRDVLTDQPASWLMGARARETVTTRYDVRRTAEQWLAAYRTVLDNHR